jgi:hypothetical protein
MTAKKLLYPLSFFQKQIRELFGKGSVLEKLLFFFSIISSLALFLYSYTQIDLGLVITRIPALYAIEKKFQYIGYFDRPLSAIIFVCLTIIFVLLYFFLMLLVQKKKISNATVWSIIGVVTIFLTFSYTAFSYDLFNYMFDAKILTHYHQNPYLHKALDYPGEPMLGFMHWTHRNYPYGPMWLVLTVPLSFIGVNVFIITFFLFKILMSASFLILLYYLYQLLKKNNEKTATENIILFALNPLVLYETMISAHNDIVMMAFAIVALFFLLQKKYWFGFLLLFISIGIKFATIALLPVFLLILLLQKQKKLIPTDKIFLLCFAIMLIPLFFVTNRTNFQTWYLLYVLPFVPLITQKYIRYISIIISIGVVFFYTSFLATGDWHSNWYTMPERFMLWMITAGCALGSLYAMYTIIKLAIAGDKK